MKTQKNLAYVQNKKTRYDRDTGVPTIETEHWIMSPGSTYDGVAVLCSYGIEPGEVESTGRLLAAAPCMLEALDAIASCLPNIEGTSKTLTEAEALVYAAIAKARGES